MKFSLRAVQISYRKIMDRKPNTKRIIRSVGLVFLSLFLMMFYQNCEFKTPEVSGPTASSTPAQSSTPSPTSSATPSPTPTPNEIVATDFTMKLSRVRSGLGRQIDIELSLAGRNWSSSDQVTVTATKNSTVTAQTSADGSTNLLKFRLTPPTGLNSEVSIQAKFSRGGIEKIVSKTALVLPFVHADFDQPEVVSGLVNTLGHEDGSSISPDGQWLMIHYLPISFDCYLKGAGSSSSPHCLKAVGPVDAPERPEMPGRDRVNSSMAIQQSCPRFNLNSPAFSVAPSSYYIFKKNSAGDFVSPREFGFKNGDGCFFPFGPQLQFSLNGSARLYIAWQNFYAGHSDANDIQSMSVDLTQPFQLGTLSSASLGLPADIKLSRMDIPATGEQGNPHVHENLSGAPVAVFWDEETEAEDNRRLKFVEKTGSTWSAISQLPSSIFNPRPGGAIQPFFDGRHMYFRQAHSLMRSQYIVGSKALASSWNTAQDIVTAGSTVNPGDIFTVGEPSITFDSYGRQTLYFVYGIIRENGVSDFNVAFVPAVN